MASPEHFKKRGVPVKPADLRTHSMISHTTPLPGRQWHYVSEGQPARIALQPSIETNDALANIAMAESGNGITLALSYMVIEQLEASELGPVVESYSLPAVPVHLIFAQRRMIPKRTSTKCKCVPAGGDSMAERLSKTE